MSGKWWQQSLAPATATCGKCGKVVTRKRGNLNSESLRRAIHSLLVKHGAKCAGRVAP